MMTSYLLPIFKEKGKGLKKIDAIITVDRKIVQFSSNAGDTVPDHMVSRSDHTSSKFR